MTATKDFFEGKVIAITGAASGMGLATANLLAQRGALLSLADRDEAGSQLAITTLSQPMNGDKSRHHQYSVIDVCQTESVDTWIKSTLDHFGRLDGAVNMAGMITPANLLVNTTDAAWDTTFAINARGVFACLRAQLPVMAEGGSIVSAASVFGQMGAPGNVAYGASKAAVIAMSRTAAKENPKIRVNCISPGSVNTPLSASENPEDVERGLQVTVQKRRAESIEVARLIAFLLSEEASFITGAVYNVDGGWMC